MSSKPRVLQSDGPLAAIGIDTIRLSYPLYHERRIALRYTEARQVGGYKIPLSEHVTLNIMRDRAALEGSLPNYWQGDNITCLSLAEAPIAAQAMYDEFSALIPWGDPGDMPSLSDLTLARVDLAVDFKDIPRSGALLDEIYLNSRSLGIPTKRYTNDGETLLLHRRRWACCLYDKHLESDGAAPEGQLRCEARLRAGRLSAPWAQARGGAVAHLDDLTEEGMALMMAATFKAVGFDRPLCTARGFDAAVDASDLAPMQKVKVSGFHHQRRCLRQVSRGAAKLYHEHAPSLAASVPGAKRLDLQTGRLVTTREPLRRPVRSVGEVVEGPACEEFRRSRLAA